MKTKVRSKTRLLFEFRRHWFFLDQPPWRARSSVPRAFNSLQIQRRVRNRPRPLLHATDSHEEGDSLAAFVLAVAHLLDHVPAHRAPVGPQPVVLVLARLASEDRLAVVGQSVAGHLPSGVLDGRLRVGRFGRPLVVVPAGRDHRQPRALEHAGRVRTEGDVRLDAVEEALAGPPGQSLLRVDRRGDLHGAVVGFDGGDQVPRDTPELPHRRDGVGQVDQECLTDHEVERVVAEGQPGGVGSNHGGDCAGRREERGVDVGADHLGVALLAEDACEFAGATADVQYPLATLQVQVRERLAGVRPHPAAGRLQIVGVEAAHVSKVAVESQKPVGRRVVDPLPPGVTDFPTPPSKPRQTKPSYATPATGRTMPSDGRVLVVDPAADEVATALEGSLSVTTAAATDPECALSALDDRRVDCVVTELRFESGRADADTVDAAPSDDPRSSRNGGLDGVALLGGLRERDPTLPVVVYTAVDLDGVDPTALAGATACVRKTDEDAESTLVEWVERCVDARTGRRDRLDGVVHDLRNPLRAANVSLARLRRDADLDDGYAADLAAAHERLGDLLDELDALVDAGRPVADADIESVVLDETAHEAWLTVDTRGATLRVETDATVDADRRKLRRLFENLFANAVEHGSTSPRSEIPGDAIEHGSTSGESTTEDGPATEVTVTVGDFADGFFVADDGSGIPEADREVVFERGYSTVDGTGYGLAIVAELVAAHGWLVAATESESGGARIDVRT